MKDPRVGRDALIGIASGFLLVLLDYVLKIGPSWWGLAPGIVINELTVLDGPRSTLALLIGSVGMAALVATTATFVFFVLMLVLRRQALAVGAFIVLAILTRIDLGPQLATTWPLVLVALLGAGLLAFLVVRVGLLALTVGVFVATIVERVPMTVDVGVWYATASWTALALIVAMGIVAVRTAIAGQPIFSMSLDG